MDISDFKSGKTGEIVSLAGEEYAFVPDKLPPQWEFPLKLWPLLAEAKQQLGILEGLGRNLPNPGILLRPLRDREAIQSSKLEGTYASPTELLLFEIEPREAKSEDDPTNDWREVYNYRKALQEGIDSELPLSLRLIRKLHETLLAGVRGRDRTPGVFRKLQVAIGSTRRFVPTPPGTGMEECLYALEKYFHEKDSRYDPLVDSFLIHYQFETIHPFLDGNGRVGRLLLAIMLQRWCGLSKPWVYLSEYFEKNRDEYIKRLFEASTSGAWTDWIDFCLQGTLRQAQDSISRCERLLRIREAFMQKVGTIGGSIRLHRIVEDIFHSPFLRIADLAARLEISYPTAKSDIDRLVEAGILKELENISPKTYYAPEVFEVAYEKMD
jgi:Fic family protein